MSSQILNSFALFRDGFHRDLIRLIAVTIIVGSVLAAGVAWAINAYFGNTVSGVIGGFGQYDFVLHARQEAEGPFGKQLANVLHTRFPGARAKQGMTVAGQANFFVSMPKEYRNRRTFETISSVFGSLPGYSGNTIMVEPSLVVRGVPDGAEDMFIGRIEKMQGVSFAFGRSGDLTVVLTDKNQTDRVEQQLHDLVGAYQVVEVRFPMGYKVKNIAEAGEESAQAVRKSLGAKVALDVSTDNSDSQTQAFNNTLVEMKRFLTSYASEVTIYPSSLVPLSAGDELVLTGPAKTPLTKGAQLDPNNIHIAVTEVSGGIAHGLIVQGDTGKNPEKLPLVDPDAKITKAPALTSVNAAYKVGSGERAAQLVGPATIANQRYQLARTADESVKLLKQLQLLAGTAQTTSARVLDTIDAYEQARGQVGEVQAALDNVNNGLSGTLSGLSKVQTDKLLTVLNKAKGGIDDLLTKVTGVRAAKSELDAATVALTSTKSAVATTPAPGSTTDATGVSDGADLANSLGQVTTETTQHTELLDQIINKINPMTVLLLKLRSKIDDAALQIQNLGLLSKNAGPLSTMLKDIGTATDSTYNAMKGLDVSSFRNDVAQISDRMKAVSQIDVGAVTKQITDVKTSLPNLRDDELGQSIQLIDRYIGGQVIPGESVQLLLDKTVNPSKVGPLVGSTLGIGKVSTYVLPAGTLQPDARGVLLQLLGKVRSTIAGLVALVAVLTTLLLDHTLIVSAVRESRRRPASRFDVVYLYGAGVGAVILVAIFYISGARLPYVSFGWLVALGGSLGLLSVALAGKLSPINGGEFMAAEAIGMSYSQILREVVIPEGRPGLLQILNRTRLKFPERKLRRRR